MEQNTKNSLRRNLLKATSYGTAALMFIVTTINATKAAETASDTVTVGITITASSSSSSSSSSSAVSSSSSEASRTDNGNKTKTNQNSINKIKPGDVTNIIANRRLPDYARRSTVYYYGPNLHQAAKTPCLDVPTGIWYEGPLAEFLNKGYIGSCNEFDAIKLTTRGDLARFLTIIYGKELILPEVASFTDAPLGSEYFVNVETAAKYGWMLGDDNCYGQADCTVRPNSPITRAEAAAMMVRYWELAPSHLAPPFYDVPEYAWYQADVQTAADYCILQGDAETNAASPERMINQAETITMLYRAMQNLQYGSDCFWQTAIDPVIPPSANVIVGSLLPVTDATEAKAAPLTTGQLLAIILLSISGVVLAIFRQYHKENGFKLPAKLLDKF